MSRLISAAKFRFLLLTALSIFLAGCQSYWNPESDFGSSVNDAIRAQTVNPSGLQKTNQPQLGMDGVSAQKSVDNYQKSFDKGADAGKGLTIRSNSIGGGVGQ